MNSKEFSIPRESELRVEIIDGETCVINLVGGSIEIFGLEVGGKDNFTLDWPCQIAFFSWDGATIKISGTLSISPYISTDTPMHEYLNVHSKLQFLRNYAFRTLTSGPRILICGPKESGKRTLSRILATYACRELMRPICVNLACTNFGLTLPGTVSAAQVFLDEIDVCKGIQPKVPLFFWHGQSNNTFQGFHNVLHTLSMHISSVFEQDEVVKQSGLIVTAGSWIDGVGLTLTKETIDLLGIDLVIVLGHDRLFAQLDAIVSTRNVGILKLSRSGGVVERSPRLRRNLQRLQLHEYFYGTHIKPLSPFLKHVTFDQFSVFQISEQEENLDLLPVGQKSLLDSCTLERVLITKEMVNSILGMVDAAKIGDLLSSPCLGFCNVQKVDTNKKIVTMLMPSPGDLGIHMKYVIMKNVNWSEC
jgi:polyribonucleotide 5'-hydroxyl-kinase